MLKNNLQTARKKQVEEVTNLLSFLRTGLALLLYLRVPDWEIRECYAKADEFLEQLVEDLECRLL